MKHCFRLFWSFLFFGLLVPGTFSSTELKAEGSPDSGIAVSNNSGNAFFSPLTLGSPDPFAKIFEESNPTGKKEGLGGDNGDSFSEKFAFPAIWWVTSLQESFRNRVKNTVRVPLFVLFHSWKSFLF